MAGARGRGRRMWAVLVTVAFVGVLFATVFPTRTFLAQRASLGAATEQLSVLDEQNRLLEERVGLLNDDAEIERLAREEYHLVRPGEEAFAVLPAPGPPRPPSPVGTPPGEADGANVVERAWMWLSDRF
ncbi:MAG: septum formation initiator family protein [Actinomycetota bacterium]|nr:septum formation initiator family protein [Actinomycetota bacterium]